MIAEGERKKRLEEQGITVNGVVHRFRILPPKEGKRVDLVIMAVKDTSLEQAIQDIRQFVGEDTQILCVMNGVDSEEKLAYEYGWEHVLYSYVSCLLYTSYPHCNHKADSCCFVFRAV